MNDSISVFGSLSALVKCLALGSVVGVFVSIFTVMLLKRLAKRVKRYQLTYVPMTLVESTLWKWTLVAYPVLFGIAFAILCAVKKVP